MRFRARRDRRSGQTRSRLASTAVALGLALPAVMMPVGASAHIVTEEPWEPVADAYRSMTFFANLALVNWDLIRKAYETPIPATAGTKTAKNVLTEIDAKAGTGHAQAIAEAVDAQGIPGLYAAASRAVSHGVRYHLDAAGKMLDRQGEVAKHVREAEALYRAFDGFIRQADPAGCREVGRAWLVVTNSIGSEGVAGYAEVAADPERLAEANGTIAV